MSAPKSSTALTPKNQSGVNLVSSRDAVVSTQNLKPSSFRKEGGEPPGLHRVFTPGMMSRAIVRRWPQALGLGLILGALAATAVWMARPDKYTSYAFLRVAPKEYKVLNETVTERDNEYTYTKTQLAIVKTRGIIKSALAEQGVRQLPLLAKQPDPIEWLEKELKAEQIEGTEFIRVSLTHRGSGSDLAPIVKAVVDTYLIQVAQRELSNHKIRLNELEEVYRRAENKFRAANSNVKEMTQNLKSGNESC